MTGVFPRPNPQTGAASSAPPNPTGANSQTVAATIQHAGVAPPATVEKSFFQRNAYIMLFTFLFILSTIFTSVGHYKQLDAESVGDEEKAKSFETLKWSGVAILSITIVLASIRGIYVTFRDREEDTTRLDAAWNAVTSRYGSVKKAYADDTGKKIFFTIVGFVVITIFIVLLVELTKEKGESRIFGEQVVAAPSQWTPAPGTPEERERVKIVGQLRPINVPGVDNNVEPTSSTPTSITWKPRSISGAPAPDPLTVLETITVNKIQDGFNFVSATVKIPNLKTGQGILGSAVNVDKISFDSVTRTFTARGMSFEEVVVLLFYAVSVAVGRISLSDAAVDKTDSPSRLTRDMENLSAVAMGRLEELRRIVK